MTNKRLSQTNQKRLLLISEDISAAEKQITSLENQITELTTELDLLKFEKNELISQIAVAEELDNEEDAIEKPDFFAVLAGLESEEAGLLGQLESYRKVQRDLEHEKRKLSYAIRNLKLEQARKNELLNQEKERIYQIKGEIDVLNQQLVEGEESLETTTALTETAKVKPEVSNVSFDLRSLQMQEREKAQELKELEKKEKRMKLELERKIRSYETSAIIREEERKKKESVSSWYGQRSVLVKKLEQSRKKLLRLQNSVIDIKKRHESMKSLVAQDDDNLTKQILRTEINEHNKVSSDTDKEIDIEQKYHKQLEGQFQLLKESTFLFNQHKNQVLNGLQQEQLGSSQMGYLELLTREMRELQHKLTNA